MELQLSGERLAVEQQVNQIQIDSPALFLSLSHACAIWESAFLKVFMYLKQTNTLRKLNKCKINFMKRFSEFLGR